MKHLYRQVATPTRLWPAMRTLPGSRLIQALWAWL